MNGQVFINEAVIREASIGVAKIENGFLTNLAVVHGTLEFARIRKGDIFDLTINKHHPVGQLCAGGEGMGDPSGWQF